MACPVITSNLNLLVKREFGEENKIGQRPKRTVTTSIKKQQPNNEQTRHQQTNGKEKGMNKETYI